MMYICPVLHKPMNTLQLYILSVRIDWCVTVLICRQQRVRETLQYTYLFSSYACFEHSTLVNSQARIYISFMGSMGDDISHISNVVKSKTIIYMYILGIPLLIVSHTNIDKYKDINTNSRCYLPFRYMYSLGPNHLFIIVGLSCIPQAFL